MSDDNNQAVNMALLTSGMYGPNPYSQFPNGIQSTSYAGTPTDALGRPLQTPPGMTLNQTPAQPQAPANSQQAMARNLYGSGMAAMPSDSFTASSNNPSGANPAAASALGQMNAGMAGGFDPNQQPGGAAMNPYRAQQLGLTAPGGAAPGGAAPVSTPAVNSYQNALQMLSNPGKVTTPGATVPQSQPITNQPSVLNQFLAAGQGGAGAGGYSNQAFFDTLNKLKGMGQGTSP